MRQVQGEQGCIKLNRHHVEVDVQGPGYWQMNCVSDSMSDFVAATCDRSTILSKMHIRTLQQ